MVQCLGSRVYSLWFRVVVAVEVVAMVVVALLWWLCWSG